MERFIKYNANPEDLHVGDCTVRAISEATGKSWDETYIGLCVQGFLMANMPSANHVWGEYLRCNGFKKGIPEYDTHISVSDFAETHTIGIYVLALPEHVVCLKNGQYIDTWNSGDETILYFWEKECK